MDNRNYSELNAEVLRWILSSLGALLLFGIAASALLAFYHPDVDSLRAQADALLTTPSVALPEPMEAALFRLGMVVIIPGLALFYHLLSISKWAGTLAGKSFSQFISLGFVICIAVLIWYNFSGPNIPIGTGRREPMLDEGVPDTSFNFFFYGFFISTYWLVYALLVVPLVVWVFFWGLRKFQWEEKQVYRISIRVITYVLIGFALVAIVAMNTFRYPYSNDNKYDFNAVYYSMTQVYAGVPMFVHGFTNTYGLYPHFLLPLFRVIGLDVLNFSGIMSLLLGAAFVMNLYVTRKFVANRLILFLGFTTMLFFSYFDRKLTTQFDCYFALFPIRYITPSLLLFLSTVYVSKPSAVLYWITFVIMAFSVLWNPEIGLICYMSWILVNVYRDFFTVSGKMNMRRIAMHLAAGIVLLPLAIYLYKGVIFLAYGSAPDMSLLWRTMFVFNNIGFMLLPMNPYGPWNLFALVLIAGFLFAIVHWYKKTVTPKSVIVLLLTLIGLGYLMYFQGRSHNVTLSSSSGFCILLLTVLGDELWQVAGQRDIPSIRVLFVVFLFLVSFSFVELCFCADKIYAAVQQEGNKASSVEERDMFESNRSFIMSMTSEGEKIHLMSVSKFEGMYFGDSKRISAFNPGMIDMFLNTDVERWEQIARDSSFSAFVDPQMFNYPYLQRLAAEIAALYELKASGRAIAMVRKRATPLPAATFFGNTDKTVVHRKYRDDTTGLNARINDAFGIKQVVLQPEFSVQALFYTRPQVYPYATVAGNLHDSDGFAISNIINSSNFLFVVNNTSFIAPLNFNQWVYAVFNVYVDHADIFINGELISSKPIPSSVRRSPASLAIGNLGNLHYYTGAIAEVQVDNKVDDPQYIRATWGHISATLSVPAN